VPDGRLVVGAPLSLTGRYGFFGRLAAAGLRQVVQGARTLGGIRMGEDRLAPELHVVDDGGTRAGVRGALEEVAEAGLLVGPYGSDLVDEAARWAAERGRVLWNHGGSADEVQRFPGVVSVPSPASRYLGPVLESLADSLPGARVLVAAGRGLFGRSAALGAREAADRLGMTLVGTVAPEEVPGASDADVVLAAGTFADDVGLVRRLRARPAAVAAVAAGISLFGPTLGPGAEGILGPSQWEEGARFSADVGPRQADAVRALRAEVVPTLRPGARGRRLPGSASVRGRPRRHPLRRGGRNDGGSGAAGDRPGAPVHHVLRPVRPRG
jgi:ABC-type branched-subunit amino acid transport system substrate-binding protein